MKKLWLLLILMLAALLFAGCDTGGSGPGLSTGPPGDDPPGDAPPGNIIPTATPIPTAPTGLPALLPDAGGLSAGFSVSLVDGKGTPPAPGALVAPVPAPDGGDIIDQDAAIRLGKALFWDMQTGSDGQMACASCHFQAGADNRTANTVHPGSDKLFGIVTGPGVLFNLVTFILDIFNGLVDDVIGSSGVISRVFGSISADLSDPVDVCAPVTHDDFLQFGTEHRLVTGRNTPPAIGAVFYLDNFWDGRASQNFNGLDPLGDGPVVAGFSSLASQAVGPPMSEVEMSCANRPFNGPNSLGAKLVPRTPLAFQRVHPEDSVLGPLANAAGNGLDCGFEDRPCSYADLIAAAFGTNGLSGQQAVNFYIDNFSSIWGQAVQAYEATLVPNRTPYDLGQMTPQQVAGLQEMRGDGCMVCHVEPEFSDATVRLINQRGGPGVQKLVNGGPGGDQGFHNIGASLTADDRGRAASPGGTYHDSTFNEGAFKTPGLRNLSLTAPYMHNGSIANILDVLAFYDGDGQQVDNLGFNPDAEVGVGGNAQVEAAVVAFLTSGLLDCRVQNKLAPFDHPSLVVPDGPTLEAVGSAGNGTTCP